MWMRTSRQQRVSSESDLTLNSENGGLSQRDRRLCFRHGMESVGFRLAYRGVFIGQLHAGSIQLLLHLGWIAGFDIGL